MIRVLHVVTIMNRNGLENRIMDIYRNIDRSLVQFDFLTHREEKGAFDDEIENLGGRIYHVPQAKITNIGNYFGKLNTFFKEHPEYQIVHAHVNTLSTWVLLAAKKAGVPVRIAHSRTWGAEKSKTYLFKMFSRLFINMPTTHKFGCSKQAGEWLFGKKGIREPNYFRVITNSIDVSKFSFNDTKREEYRIRLGLRENDIAIVHVGRFTQQKNHMFLLETFAEFNKLHTNSFLFLIGFGDLEASIDKKAKELGIAQKVRKIGQVSNVGDYLNAMDAFVFPSYFEGFGTVTIESQCNGLPILASDSIPSETKVTDVQEFESLNKSPLEWACHLDKMLSNTVRRDRTDEICAAGYNILDTYRFLQDFYISVVGENCARND